MRKNIPNLLTLLNLVSGFVAIIFILKGSPGVVVWLILAAMVLDFADGMAARLLNAWSELGKELDSLADMVSFGLVPGLMVYVFSGNIDSETVRIAVAALLPVFAAIRLARFNISAAGEDFFRGLPSPAAALAIISLLPAAEHGSRLAVLILNSPAALVLYAAITALLMIMPVRMMSLKMKSFSLKANYGRYLFLILSAAGLMLNGWGGLFLIIPLYLIVSLAGRLTP